MLVFVELKSKRKKVVHRIFLNSQHTPFNCYPEELSSSGSFYGFVFCARSSTACPSSVSWSFQRDSKVLSKKIRRCSLLLVDKSAIIEGFACPYAICRLTSGVSHPSSSISFPRRRPLSE